MERGRGHRLSHGSVVGDRGPRGRRTLHTRELQRRGPDCAGGVDGVGYPATADVVDHPGTARDRSRQGCGDRASGEGSGRALVDPGTPKVDWARSARHVRMTSDATSYITAICGRGET